MEQGRTVSDRSLRRIPAPRRTGQLDQKQRKRPVAGALSSRIKTARKPFSAFEIGLRVIEGDVLDDLAEDFFIIRIAARFDETAKVVAELAPEILMARIA